MITFEVRDMSCGHCVSSITQAVRALDAGAQVEVDLGKKLVQVEPTVSNAQQLSEAIAEAGYTPVLRR
jgi:copper chaperone